MKEGQGSGRCAASLVGRPLMQAWPGGGPCRAEQTLELKSLRLTYNGSARDCFAGALRVLLESVDQTRRASSIKQVRALGL